MVNIKEIKESVSNDGAKLIYQSLDGLNWKQITCKDINLNIDLIISYIVSKNLSARSVEILVRRKKAPQKSGQIRIDSNILDQQRSLRDKLGLNVSIINKKNNSGKITIEYKNLEQFELVSKLLKQN